MLNEIVRTTAGKQRHLATPIGPYLKGYLQHRCNQGFAASTLASNLKWVTSFGEYLAEKGHYSLADLGEETLEDFAVHYATYPRRFGPKRVEKGGSISLQESLRGSIRSLLAFLRNTAVTKPLPPQPPTVHHSILEEYLSFLRFHRGFAELTVEQHSRWGRAFFEGIGKRRPCEELTKITAPDIEAVVISLAEGRGRRCRQIMTATINSIIRYLHATRRLSPSGQPFLPQMKSYALSALPSIIPESSIRKAIDGIDRSGAGGLRDYALVLIVATYGLRARA